MSDPEERIFEAVDRLVRAHLDGQTERTDATDLHARIREELAPAARPAAATIRTGRAAWISFEHWPRVLSWSMGAALIAIVVGAFFGGRSLSPTTANAATLLRTARGIHAHGLDRCYRVHYAPDPRYWDGKKMLEGPSESVLWTRGDRFWANCTIGTIHLAIGREADRSLWVSPSRMHGIRFADRESQLPHDVAVLCEINSMTVPSLMDEVLADFHLRAEGPTSNAGTTPNLVWARLKPGRSHSLISAALLEIDAQSGVLLRLILWTVREGRPNGTVTYTLIQSAKQDDEQYRLASHLDPGAKVEIHRLAKTEASTQ
ncbi:hypothetical protein SAMN05444166_8463 [Singulisphaera sp. GP187]|uniref:hypothetical protein n=1 Tax=Singulisphaera sp. GP187 TaxID=1882752 RepID=UPI00092994C1|nr:hypothetical protein [Singulisphaera sp. GP187]SIO67915.1 hypothetical protein SAMN05444166_8463 [Singulisphaera sp. GP187]